MPSLSYLELHDFLHFQDWMEATTAPTPAPTCLVSHLHAVVEIYCDATLIQQLIWYLEMKRAQSALAPFPFSDQSNCLQSKLQG